jgi:signal transduction histidine kinase
VDPARTVVLVADDNAENRALAQATLEDEGYRVSLAGDGAEAVSAFARERPACILLDIQMPNVDGILACQQIRALPGGAAVAVVFVTAQRDVATFDRALAAGGDDFITKPFRPAELVVRVQAALRVRQLAGERNELYDQLKHQRDDLQRLQLQKEQLVAFLVHDLKNPVGAIDLHAQRLLRDPGITERSRGAALTIRDEARALTRMIMNLLDLAKADEGRLVPGRAEIDPSALVRAAFDELELRGAAASVTLGSEITARTIQADPDLLHRLLVNLVDNAIRFAPEDSAVQVSITAAADGLEIRVRDAGPGIPEDRRERVFQRFESEQSTRTNRGLGLAFCKLAVEAHGGRIWIEDASPGAVFCVRIPDVP